MKLNNIFYSLLITLFFRLIFTFNLKNKAKNKINSNILSIFDINDSSNLSNKTDVKSVLSKEKIVIEQRLKELKNEEKNLIRKLELINSQSNSNYSSFLELKVDPLFKSMNLGFPIPRQASFSGFPSILYIFNF